MNLENFKKILFNYPLFLSNKEIIIIFYLTQEFNKYLIFFLLDLV